MPLKVSKQQIISAATVQDLDQVADALLEYYPAYSVWCLSGPMGAGKTTFTTVLCKKLNATDAVSSPTFSLVNEYFTKNLGIIYHFDFYRLNDPEQAMDIGVEEYLDSGKLCLLEWPDLVEELLPDKYLDIQIECHHNQKRTFYIRTHGE